MASRRRHAGQDDHLQMDEVLSEAAVRRQRVVDRDGHVDAETLFDRPITAQRHQFFFFFCFWSWAAVMPNRTHVFSPMSTRPSHVPAMDARTSPLTSFVPSIL